MESTKEVINTPTDEVINIGKEHTEAMRSLRNRLQKLTEKVGCAEPLEKEDITKDVIDPSTILDKHRALNSNRGEIIDDTDRYISQLENAL